MVKYSRQDGMGPPLIIQPQLRQTVETTFGDAGREWLQQLPAIIREYEARWSLRVDPPYPELSYHYVAPAKRADGTDVVLKLGVPNPGLLTETEALQTYGGRGCARLIEADPSRGAMLLDRLRPGETLWSVEDSALATTIAAGVMKTLWRSPGPDHTFPSLAEWSEALGRLRERFGGGTGPLPLLLFEQAESIFAELLASTHEPVLLHGDLHQGNILSAGEKWLAIDPKGVVGDRAYEPAAYLLNLMSRIANRADAGEIMDQRVEQFAEELGLDTARIRGWANAQSVLSACWTIEDGGDDWGEAIACAELLAGSRSFRRQ